MKIHDRPYDLNMQNISQSSNGEDKSRIYQNMSDSRVKNVSCKQKDGDIASAIRKLTERLDQYYKIEFWKKGGSDIVLRELKENHGIDLLNKVNEEEKEEEEKEEKKLMLMTLQRKYFRKLFQKIRKN